MVNAYGELRPGETLPAATGSATVLTVRLLHQAVPVYNIEVHGEHVYEVGQLGLLVHNSTDDCAAMLKQLGDVPWGQYFASGCEAIAMKIQVAVGGTIHTIRPIRGRLLGPRGNIVTQWFDHQVVVKDGIVYDALTGPNGLPIEQFKKLWEFADDIDFGF